jgi:hypothetical protein
MRALLHLLSTASATLEVDERIDVHAGTKNEPAEAIPSRYEPFKGPKSALLKRFYSEW